MGSDSGVRGQGHLRQGECGRLRSIAHCPSQTAPDHLPANPTLGWLCLGCATLTLTHTYEHTLLLTDFCSDSVVLAFRLQQRGTSSRKSALLTLVGREVQRGKFKTSTPPCSPPSDPAQLALTTAPTTQHERGSWGLRLHSAPSLTPCNLQLQFYFCLGRASFCR